MSLKTYIPLSIESEVERVRQGDSKISPSYFTTSLVRPTAISRNLLQVFDPVSIAADVASLAVPNEHDSEDALNSRSFDYDYLISNIDDTAEKHFFIMDTGSVTWFITFNEEIEDSVFKFKVEATFENEPNLNLNSLSYKLLNTSSITSNIVSSVDGTKPHGYGIDYLDVDYEIYVSETEEDDTSEENSSTSYYVTIETSRDLSIVEKQAIKDINAIVAFKDDNSLSNIRFFNKLLYSPSTNDYYIYNNTNRFENLRNYLVNAGIKPYAAYAGSLENEEALMFSVEVKYNSTIDFSNSLTQVSEGLNNSAVIMSNNNYSLTGFQTMFFRLPEEDSSTILSVELLDVAETEDEDGSALTTVTVLRSQENTTNPLIWYNFFKSIGITASTVLKKIVTTKVEEVEVPAEDPEDLPTTEEIEVEDVIYVLKGFVLKLDYSMTDESSIHMVRFNTNGNSISTLGGEAKVSNLRDNLVLPGSSVEIYPTAQTSDGYSKTYTVGYRNPLNTLSNSFKISFLDTSTDFKVYKSVANSLIETDYDLSASVNIAFTKTPFFNLGYGVSEGISSLKDFLSDHQDITVESNSNYAELIVNNNNPSVKHMYLKTDKDNKISTESTNHLKTPSELLFQTDSSNIISRAFKSVLELPYIVVDLANLDFLEIYPYSYLTADQLILKEQDTAEINVLIDSDVDDKELYFKSLMETLSTSKVSVNFLPIVPLLTADNEFAQCFAIFYDPVTIEGKLLSNAFVKINKNSLLDSYSNVNLKYKVGYSDGTAVYEDLTLPTTAEIEDYEYFKITSPLHKNLYSTELKYSFSSSCDVVFKVLDCRGNTLETHSFVRTLGESFEEIVSNYLNILEDNTNLLSIKLKDSAEEERYSLLVVNNSGGSIRKSAMVFEISEDTSVIPLNKVV